MSPKKITVKFFALLREQAGCRETVVTTTAATPLALYEELQSAHALTVSPRILNFAVNERYVAADIALRDGDRVAFIPPVAGG